MNGFLRYVSGVWRYVIDRLIVLRVPSQNARAGSCVLMECFVVCVDGWASAGGMVFYTIRPNGGVEVK